ncbi:MAG: polymer-forming cytoskeletal protein [Cyclobacteriaceae bacterium]|nr:polymer-forming cytoskeletal protein [Cyclobacteriaceae bacterium]
MFKNKEENLAAQEATNSSNIIGKGTIVEGNIETFGNIRIEGRVNGSVKSKSKIALGQSSFVEGNILAQNAEISGEVKGVVEVSDQLILRPSAVIKGDIVTNKLIVESGATFNGGCKMGISQKDIKIGDNGHTKPFEAKKPTTPETKTN